MTEFMRDETTMIPAHGMKKFVHAMLTGMYPPALPLLGECLAPGSQAVQDPVRAVELLIPAQPIEL